MKKALKTALIILFFALFSIPVCAFPEAEITSFAVTDGRIEIKAAAEGIGVTGEIGLFSVFSGSDALASPAAVSVPGNEMTFSVDARPGDGKYFSCGWCLGAAVNGKYERISGVFYPDLADIPSLNDKEYPVLGSKKGLNVTVVSEADLLCVRHSTVNVVINGLIAEKSENAVPFVFGGKLYYANRGVLNVLDTEIRSLTLSGIHVYLDLLYTDTDGNRILPGCDAETFAAYTFFLAERYSRDGSPYGFCGSFIIGKDVNRREFYSSAGASSVPEAARLYADYFTAAYRASRAAYESARVFVPITDEYEISADVAGGLFFGAKEFLSSFMPLCPFDWSTAVRIVMTDRDDGVTRITAEMLTLLTSLTGERKIAVYDYGADPDYDIASAFVRDYGIFDADEHVESVIWGRQRDGDGRQDGIFAPTGKKDKNYSAFASVGGKAEIFSGTIKSGGREHFDFSHFAYGFFPTNSSSYIETDPDGKGFTIAARYDGSDSFFGAGCELSSFSVLGDKIYLTVEPSCDGRAVIMLINGDGTYCCEAPIKKGEENRLCFDIAGITDGIDTGKPTYFKIGALDGNGNSGMSLKVLSIRFAEERNSSLIWIGYAAAVFAAAALMFSVCLFVKSGKKPTEE